MGGSLERIFKVFFGIFLRTCFRGSLADEISNFGEKIRVKLLRLTRPDELMHAGKCFHTKDTS